MKARWIGFVRSLAVAFVIALTIGCGGSAPTAAIPGEAPVNEPSGVDITGGGAATLTSSSAIPEVVAPQKNLFPEVVIKTTAGNFRVRLNAEKAPVTVENFLESYVDRGFYANTIFHHVDPGYVVAGGFTPDLEPKETRASIRNEASNGLKNKRGTITMSRSPEFSDSATSQFFINVTAATSLDYDEATENAGYCVFGEVVDGMDVVDRIAKSEVHDTGDFPQMPVEAILITSIERID
ncbi:MAG: peptidylprolyl isomerase [Planctomycetaceae bacterium]|nr:peptidylprolyl isomerase [Planctomycetales bacterium]MCB9875070.1 peptidylprolyl isomerase [Planctomycetaceae bacterium]MCB9939906.1 peptidylprolyl isomerase [Planctomycetaceae bacterium]